MTGIMFNEDDSHFGLSRSDEELTTAGLDAFLDIYANTSIREMSFCVGHKRLVYATEAEGWDARFDNLNEADEWYRNWGSVKAAACFHELGIDYLCHWLEGSRKRGMKGWLSIRTNDIHGVWHPESPMHGPFWAEHPEYWRRPYRRENQSDRALDYAQPAVRTRLLNLVRELVQRFPIDGIELDWMRQPHAFRPGHERAGAPLLTAMMREIRAIAHAAQSAAGHTIEIGVRVPSRPESCRGFGLDVVTWARQGLVDRVIPSPDMNLDNEIPVAHWRTLLDGTTVLLCPGVNNRLISHPGMNRFAVVNGKKVSRTPTAAMLRGACTALLYGGADRIHFFNLFDRFENPDVRGFTGEEYRSLLEDCGSLERLAMLPRRHVLTFHDMPAPGEPIAAALPAPCGPHGEVHGFQRDTAMLRITTGPFPPPHLAAVVRLAFRQDQFNWSPGAIPNLPQGCEVRVNGTCCVLVGECSLGHPGPDTSLWEFAIPAAALTEGSQLIEVLPSRATHVEWAEIAYTKGDEQ